KITPSGTVTTFAGSGAQKFEDGTGTNASFNIPFGLVFDSFQNLFVVDSYNNRIRKITPSSVVTTIAGTGDKGANDGLGISSSFNFPQGITIDLNDNLYIADIYNNKIRKITPSTIVSTIAGSGETGKKDGNANEATFDSPADVSFDNYRNLIVADLNNNNIRKISPLGIVSTIAGNGVSGNIDGTATDASFNGPTGIIINNAGEIYITTRNNTVRKIINKNGTYSINPLLPEGLKFNPINGEIYGTAKAIMPKTEFTVSATNEYGSASYTFAIQINDIAPNITYQTPNLFNQDKLIVPLLPSNTGGKIITYIINPNLPSGLDFNIVTGEISGTPNNSTPNIIYTITASNTGGSSSFEISIGIMEENEENIKIQISEAITPNGDGINDYWIIKNIEKYTNSIIYVYNRWGTEVYSARNYQNDWDGHYKNNAQSLPDSSSYLYQIDIEGDGSIDYQGWIYITK
ncbi:T9SS type B sorting domain-containing protein, partial [Flavobacterium sp. CGRL2]